MKHLVYFVVLGTAAYFMYAASPFWSGVLACTSAGAFVNALTEWVKR